jgi:hypothetical protein
VTRPRGPNAPAERKKYCLIEGSKLLPLFACAAVIDNRSQNPIFLPVENDPEKPPIVPLVPRSGHGG